MLNTGLNFCSLRQGAALLGLAAVFLFSAAVFALPDSAAADPSAPADSNAAAKPADASSGPKGALGKDAFSSIDQKAPLLIKSKSLQLDSKERTFTYKDDVEVQKGDLVITADVVVGTYNEKNEIQKIVCQNNVVITRGESLRASSNRAVYFVDRDVIEMTEGPDLIHQGSALSADKITFYVAEDRSEAEGNVRVKVIGADELKSGNK